MLKDVKNDFFALYTNMRKYFWNFLLNFKQILNKNRLETLINKMDLHINSNFYKDYQEHILP